MSVNPASHPGPAPCACVCVCVCVCVCDMQHTHVHACMCVCMHVYDTYVHPRTHARTHASGVPHARRARMHAYPTGANAIHRHLFPGVNEGGLLTGWTDSNK
jgi:hypothetical protein